MKDMLVGSWPFWMEHGGRRRDSWFNRDNGFANHACNGGRKRNFGTVNRPVLFFDWFSSFRARIVNYQGFWGPLGERIIMERVKMGEKRKRTCVNTRGYPHTRQDPWLWVSIQDSGFRNNR